ncbi:hypothetical protein KR222_002029, partial [Zaprionus bogoriensis]
CRVQTGILSTTDPVMASYPMLGSPWPLTILVGSYLLFVLKLGKMFMEHRQPYNLKKVLIAYNIFQVIFNGGLFGISCEYTAAAGVESRVLRGSISLLVYYFINRAVYNITCMVQLPVDYPEKYIEHNLSYAYFINKLLDLLDTLFFVFRKSYKQITFLHVFHHSLMAYSGYWIVRFYGVGGQFASMGLINLFVHTVMYFYYLMTAIFTELKGNLWWKKYITIMQLTQFAVLWLLGVLTWLFNPNCAVSTTLQKLWCFTGLMFFVMFSNFYWKTYIKPRQKKVEKVE